MNTDKIAQSAAIRLLASTDSINKDALIKELENGFAASMRDDKDFKNLRVTKLSPSLITVTLYDDGEDLQLPRATFKNGSESLKKTGAKTSGALSDYLLANGAKEIKKKKSFKPLPSMYD